MIVISSHLVLQAVTPLDLDLPVIGWHNVVTTTSIAADSEQPNYPVSNLANPATHLVWKSDDDAEQYLTIGADGIDPVDYVAVARHNWGSASIAVSIEGFIDGDWEEICEEVLLPDDAPALFRFHPQPLTQLRIRLKEGDAAPWAAVVYAGKLLVMERKVWVGHTPMPLGIKSSVVNNRSETGNFLGRTVLGEWRESTLPLSLLSPDWFRANMKTFLAAAVSNTFFLAWRPQSYPREVGYCWTMDDPAPAGVGPSNLYAFDLKLSGIA